MPDKKQDFLPQPSRIILNAGILTGGLIGFILSIQGELDATQSFMITGICCLIGAGVFSYSEVLFRRYRQSKK